MSSMKGYVCTAVVDAVPLDNVLDELVVRVGRVGFRSRSRGPEGGGDEFVLSICLSVSGGEEGVKVVCALGVGQVSSDFESHVTRI